MSASFVGLLVFACTVAGAGIGMALQYLLPRHHLGPEAKDTVSVAAGMIATLTALVLGLLIAAAKDSYDLKNNEFQRSSADVILLDRVLKHYGPEAGAAREALKRTVATLLANVDDETTDVAAWNDVGAMMGVESVQDELRRLEPKSTAQSWLQSRGLEVSGNIARSRWLLVEQNGGAIQPAFLAILVFWLTAIFASFGLFAPRTSTIATALVICSLSTAGAIYLLLELDNPTGGGLLQISDAPLRRAALMLGQ